MQSSDNKSKGGVGDETDVHVMKNLKLLKQTNQLLAMMTIIRDRETERSEFVFYADRVIRLLIEEALNEIPVYAKKIVTPTNCEFDGVTFSAKICGISVVRAGESMENALMTVCRGCRIGKILIQRNEENAQPVLYFYSIPEDIAKRHVLLLDPMCATSGSICEALRIIKEKGVPEDKIVFICLVAAPIGIRRVLDAHPGVTIVCAAIDDGLNEKRFIMPGIGDFGDRYFGI